MTASARSSKRSLVPDLPRRAWVILSADAVSALGNGLIIPFLVIYLRDVRRFPIQHVGLVLSTQAVAGLVGAPIAGWLVDLVGARRALMAALFIAGAGSAAAILVDHLWQAFAWAAVFGFAISAMWPAAHSFMAGVVPQKLRSAIFSVHFALLNAGIGLGAILGGLITDVDRPATFAAIFFIDAASFLIYFLVLRLVVSTDVGVEASNEPKTEGGWARVWADRAFMRICLLSVILITLGYGQLASSFPAFATNEGGISTRALGAVFAVNTAVIVAMQLLVLDRLGGRRRTRAVVVVCLLWAGSWMLTIAAGDFGGGLAGVVMFMVACGVFGLGETFMQAALPALVNDLAPDDIRGRYNAAYSLTWSTGFIIGPALGGFMLGADRGVELFVLLALACAAASLYAIRLERFIPATANRFAARDLVESPIPEVEPGR